MPAPLTGQAPLVEAVASLLAPFLPTPELALGLAPFSLAYAVVVGWIAGRLRATYRVRTAYTRKIFHFAIFTVATIVQVVWGLPGVAVFGSVVVCVVGWAAARGDGDPIYEALARPQDAPHRTLFVLLPLAMTVAGGVGANLLFPGYAHVGYLACGWGDAAGEPVGARWGRHHYRVSSVAGGPAVRSIEGSCAVFLAGLLAAHVALLAQGMPLTTAAYVALGVGLAAASVEAISSRGTDNLTVQLAAAGAAQWLSL